MKYYYLINGKIMSANEKMPEIHYNHTDYNQIMMTWKDSLKQCEISESELEKVEKHILKSQNIFTSTPIEITDIISDNNGVVSFKEKEVSSDWQKFYDEIKPTLEKYNLNNLNSAHVIKVIQEANYNAPTKQVEEIEAVEFLDFVLSSGWHLNPHSKENRWRTIEQINSTKPMLSDGITTKQLYEIFKNQK